MQNYTREQLIKLCERSIVQHKLWKNRDSYAAQTNVGSLLVLLKAGCKFELATKENSDRRSKCICDEDTLWVRIWVKDFIWFENLDEETEPEGRLVSDIFYLPTEKRLLSTIGSDWY